MEERKLESLSSLEVKTNFSEAKELEGELTAIRAIPTITREFPNGGNLCGFLRNSQCALNAGPQYMEFSANHNSIKDLIILAEKEKEPASFKGIYDKSSQVYRIYGVEFSGMIEDSEDTGYGKINSK